MSNDDVNQVEFRRNKTVEPHQSQMALKLSTPVASWIVSRVCGPKRLTCLRLLGLGVGGG